ncbi:ankyrin repeat and MYND domain-containing protein 1-like isoform X4 [Stigmatopora argus]
MLSNPGAVLTARGRVTMKLKLRPGSPKNGVVEVIRQGFAVQEFLDGSKYEGDFDNGLKHGEGKYTWKNGEVYEGSFYKDYRHGNGMYCWPSGNKFIGKFYLNWREGYGVHIFPDGATFKGLYHADQRFGPGVLTESNGCQDVGLWHGKHLIQLCTPVQGSFSLKNLTEYAAYLEQTIFSHSQSQVDSDESWIPNDTNNAFPCGMENYSADGDHLPFPPDRKREFDNHFYGQLGESDCHVYKGYRRESHNSLPLQVRILAHIHKHRRQAETLDWDVDAVLSLKRQRFGPKGQLEVTSELLIQQASIGKGPAILKFLLDGLVHPDVADSQGHTALIAATVNCHNDVIQLLLDLGADIDKVNCEGMSALSVCHVLYYPFQSLYTFAGLTCTTKAKETKVYTEGDEEKVDSKRKGLYPLHVAAALPGLEGPEITKLLLHALTDPDARACDQDDIYEPDKGPTITAKSWRIRNKTLPKEGGRTALHIACQRDSDYCNASKVVSLLLSYKASTDFLWSGHSPLSLAIASGNNTAVEELLKGGVDPNLPLGRGVGSALCALGNFNYRLDANRPKLLDMLEKVGADILMPVQVGDAIGTAVDYAHVSFDQDSGIAHTPYHALSMAGRETFRIQRQLLSMMGSLLKKSVAQKERDNLEREEYLVQRGAISPSAVKRRSPFRFCYHCGRSAAVKLTACTRCHKVFYCSMACKLIAWDERHKEECLREAGSVPVTFEKRFQIQTKKGPKTIIFSSRRPFNVQFKSQVMVLDDNTPDWEDINLKENYSYN